MLGSQRKEGMNFPHPWHSAAKPTMIVLSLPSFEEALVRNTCRPSQVCRWTAVILPMTVQSTYPRGDERRGNAQSGKLHVNAPSPVGKQQWPLASAILARRMSRCKLLSGSNGMRLMMPSRKDVQDMKERERNSLVHSASIGL